MKRQKLIRLIPVFIAVIVIILYGLHTLRSGSEAPLDGGTVSTLVTLPPQTSAPTEAPEAAEPAEDGAETETAEAGELELLPDEYPEDIGYTDGSSLDIDEYGTYSGAEDVAYYLHTYGHLPDNYITKAEAEDAGWVSTKGNLWDVAYGASIGGDRFGNREGLLPKGETYYECDVNYTGGYRGEERLIFTDDGDVYYTNDHYRSFEKLY